VRIDPLPLAAVTRVPDWHPPVPGGGYPVFGFIVHHSAGAVVVDTGVGVGNPVIDEWYAPQVTPLSECLRRVGVRIEDVVALVNTHLHFDHCGQNHALPGVPTWVQQAEVDAAAAPGYTVPEWADVPGDRLRVVDGDHELLDGITLLATPGHTPGHQSVLVEDGGRRDVIVGQAAWTPHEWESGVPVADAFSPEWHDTARRSVERLRALDAGALYFSHG
jgi:N-acyl homoserine lactone hydrolase